MLEFEESQRDLKGDIIDVAWTAVWMILMIFAGFFALTKGRGLENTNNFVRFTLFGVMIVAFLVFALAVVMTKFFKSEGFWKNVYVPLFDPEKGLFPIEHGFRFLLYTLLAITFLAFISSFQPQSSLANSLFPLEVGGVQQDVTGGAKVLFGFYNSPAENAFLYIILGVLVTLEFVILTKYTPLQRKQIFLIFLLPNIVIGSVAWLQIHDLVSADNSLKEVSHLVFGAEMSASVLLTGTIIIPEVLHAMNNFFLTMLEVYGRGVLIASFTFIFLVLLISVVALELRRKEG